VKFEPMKPPRQFEVACETIEFDVSENNSQGELLFRAPVILESGWDKSYPHEIDLEHVQIGDSIICVKLFARPSGLRVLDALQFWNVLDVYEPGCFRVECHNIVGCGFFGHYVVANINRLLGKKG
jgi:hypothetical protein